MGSKKATLRGGFFCKQTEIPVYKKNIYKRDGLRTGKYWLHYWFGAIGSAIIAAVEAPSLSDANADAHP